MFRTNYLDPHKQFEFSAPIGTYGELEVPTSPQKIGGVVFFTKLRVEVQINLIQPALNPNHVDLVLSSLPAFDEGYLAIKIVENHRVMK